MLFNRQKSGEILGKLSVEEKRLVNPMPVEVWCKFVESVSVAHDAKEIEALPCPIEA